VTAASDKNQQRTAEHLGRFLAHTDLRAIHWINIRQNTVTFKTIDATAGDRPRFARKA